VISDERIGLDRFSIWLIHPLLHGLQTTGASTLSRCESSEANVIGSDRSTLPVSVRKNLMSCERRMIFESQRGQTSSGLIGAAVGPQNAHRFIRVSWDHASSRWLALKPTGHAADQP
jgi:hypothetical protein